MTRVLPAIVLLAACAPRLDAARETHTIDAQTVDQTYTIQVAVPADAEGPLPVVVLFDGDQWM